METASRGFCKLDAPWWYCNPYLWWVWTIIKWRCL